jgi:TetR/AcrR family transcriptional regulator
MGRPRGDIEPRIVHAARKRFLAEGVDGASLRAIARDAGTSIGMVYYYHRTKDDLFLAVVEEVYVELLKGLESAFAHDRPVVERVQGLYERLSALSPDESQVLRLVIREALASPRRFEHLAQRFLRGHVPLLLGLVGDGVAEGLFRGDLPLPLLAVALGALGGPGQAVLGVLESRLAPGMVPPATTRPAALLDILLHGIGRAAS